MQALLDRYKDRGLRVVTIMVWQEAGGPVDVETVARWADQYQLNHPVLAQDPLGASGFQLLGDELAPQYFLLDEDMTVLVKSRGLGGAAGVPAEEGEIVRTIRARLGD